MQFRFFNFKFYLLAFLCLHCCNALSLSEFFKLREKAISDEEKTFFGSDLQLVGKEVNANKCLMDRKYKELNAAFEGKTEFLPSKIFMDARDDMEKSEVYKIIKKMPKGGLLHAHSTAVASIDYLLKHYTHYPNLYVCFDKKLQFRFFKTPTKDCNWKLLKEQRAIDPKTDERIKKYLSLPVVYSSDAIWLAFEEIFDTLKGLMTHTPVFKKYLYQALQELYDDNIMYMELRVSSFKLYELDGTSLDPVTVAKIYKEVIDQFTKDHKGFIGAKMIVVSYRKVPQNVMEANIKTYRDLKRAMPDFFVGFDLVGQEDKGNTLLNYAEKLLDLGKDASFFFHAGETNWFGFPTDENLFDAVLLNTKRIGHSYALMKHPQLLETVKSRNIAVEVSPISNQVLGYVSDLRNHPASHYFAKNLAVVLTSDDPSLWGATGLSYDFYEAFMGIMSRKADLRSLKKLAMNSITYSSLNEQERSKAMTGFNKSWIKFVDDIVKEYKC